MNDLSTADYLSKLAARPFRDGYLTTRVLTGLSYQIKAIRKKAGLSVHDMAFRADIDPVVIERLEAGNYGPVPVQTLIDIASGSDLALMVHFVSYPELIEWSVADRDLQPDTVYESLEKATVPAKATASHGPIGRTWEAALNSRACVLGIGLVTGYLAARCLL